MASGTQQADEVSTKAAKKAEKAARKAEKAARKAEKASRKAEKASKKPDEASKKAEKASKKAEKASKKTDEASKKAEKPGKGSKKAGKASKGLPRIPLVLEETRALEVASASAVAPLGAGRLLVVDDDEGIHLVTSDGGATLLRGRREAAGLGDLESVCTSDDGKTVYAVSEEDGEVFAFSVSRGSAPLSRPRRLGALPRPGSVENKGWEGASFLAPAGGRGACLVVAHEREPMALGIFTLPALREVAVIPLDDGPIGALIADFADVAVCPGTDHLFLLSDESHRIVEARLDLDARRLEPLAVLDLDLSAKDKPEGLAFEGADRLVVVTDHASLLLRFSLARR
jgi:uncharacterized protein YjiK